MPSEQSQSLSHTQMQTRPALDGRRSTTNSGSDSPFGSPHGHGKAKAHTHAHAHAQRHVVGGGRGAHARVPSSKGLHKSGASKVHVANEGSQTDLKKLARNASATSLKKNSSHGSLKRNRSTADITKRPKSSNGQEKKHTAVHFEIGDQDEASEGWEEASQSASPALSRAVSSGKPSANTSEQHSPSQSPPKIRKPVSHEQEDRSSVRSSAADAKAITERLLLRTPSHSRTKMSLATATPDTSHSPPSPEKSQASNGSLKTGSSGTDVVSRFVGGSDTPSDNSPFLQNRRSGNVTKHYVDEVRKSHSMGNLTRPDSEQDEEEEERALAPRSRKSSTGHSYVPPQQSRTQQKLWLQRASSNIEPQQMGPGIPLNSLHAGISNPSLVGAGYDGRDPRIKLQLERTGLEYLVVRRYQDPVGKALKRLDKLPGAEKNRRIPPNSTKVDNPGRYGLSQSLKENRAKEQQAPSSHGTPALSSSQDDTVGMSGRTNDDDDGVGALLRSMWEKQFDLSASAD